MQGLSTPARDVLDIGEAPFAVLDVETTGFSPRHHDRIIEIAVVRTTPDGDPESEFATLVNPGRDVGATHVHGITATDLKDAPRFEDIVGDVLEQLRGAVMVAHNARYDREFVAAEVTAAGVEFPDVPTMCTLWLAYRLETSLSRHRLRDCCSSVGIELDNEHTALGDAKATAALLRVFIQSARNVGLSELSFLGCKPDELPTAWPTVAPSGRRCVRSTIRAPREGERHFISELVARLSPIDAHDADTGAYLDLLDRVLEDRIVTEAEAETLRAIAQEWGLSSGQVEDANRSYLHALVETALLDGRISESEQLDLDAVRRLLGIEDSILQLIVDCEQRNPEEFDPVGVTAPDLRGLSVCFTGQLAGRLNGITITRAKAQELARAAGLTLRDSVTNDLDLLVVGDPNTLSGKARGARKKGTRIIAEPAFWRAIGVQVE